MGAETHSLAKTVRTLHILPSPLTLALPPCLPPHHSTPFLPSTRLPRSSILDPPICLQLTLRPLRSENSLLRTLLLPLLFKDRMLSEIAAARAALFTDQQEKASDH